MGRQKGRQPKLFYCDVNIEERVPKMHILHKINKVIDFDFIYQEVGKRYGTNGNVSVPPPVILMLLLVLYNVRSERELEETLPMRLDWLWFLGLDIDSRIPDHSVLSKARARWGVEVFRSLFERAVGQCVKEGLVDGKKLFVDASLIEADASENSVIKSGSLKKYLRKGYRKLEKRLDDLEVEKKGKANKEYISTTDPDASVTRHGKGVCAQCHLRAQCTRAKDGRTLKRHIRQNDLERMLELAGSPLAKQDLKTRQHLSERSFAQSTRYGYKRARWRNLWRMQIQDYLIAALQNIQTLVRETERRAANAVRVAIDKTTVVRARMLSVLGQISLIIFWEINIIDDSELAFAN